jgi:hypothetical protein
MDKEDEFMGESHSAFSGLSDILVSFGEQISGGIGIPLIRLFGQAPKGMNATGESDLKTYYDTIRNKQDSVLRVPVTKVYRCIAQSLGINPGKGFGINFRPLWQMSSKEKAEVASIVTDTVVKATEAGLATQQTGMQELRQSSGYTNIFTNITDEDINSAEMELPPGPAEVAENAQNNEEASILGAKVSVKKKGKGSEPKEPTFDSNFLARTIDRLTTWYNRRRARTTDTTDLARQYENIHDGLQIVIENPKGTVRRGVGWAIAMPADYGYIRKTTGEDGDQVDCYVGPDPKSNRVYVIAQNHPGTQEFDEYKCMLGFSSKEDAVTTYVSGYSDGTGPGRIGGILDMHVSEFKDWLM